MGHALRPELDNRSHQEKAPAPPGVAARRMRWRHWGDQPRPAECVKLAKALGAAPGDIADESSPMPAGRQER